MTAVPQSDPSSAVSEINRVGTARAGVDSTTVSGGRSGSVPLDTGHGPDVIDMVLKAERATVGTQRVGTERIRISKHIITETKTVSIEVRREELRVERLPAQGSDDSSGVVADRPHDGAPVVVLVLWEEIPQFRLQVVPVERIQVFVDTITETETADVTLRREKVDVITKKPDSF